MSIRQHKTRELAMQVMYLWDFHGLADRALAMQSLERSGEEIPVREDAAKMADGAWEFHKTADEWMTRLAPQWSVARQPAVDRAIIRLAVWELTHTDTPPKVVLDEAIELAKEFSTKESGGFVNGVLDAVLKEQTALKVGVQ